MRNAGRNDACPCGSGIKFKKCCGPYLDGISWPPTPEALMRSRFTAYVVGAVRHLYRTVHPDNEEIAGIPYEEFARDTAEYCRQITFTDLVIHEVWPENEEGMAKVVFTATYTSSGHSDSLTELAEFVRQDGNWIYLRGEARNEEAEPVQA
ncbi:MAG TPA: YchJ family metal-binding protein [Symbiobacteriaceae bacterium]|nr:YchJ family metal-binding protein [Symbiobacteriaceae bacterium]